MSQLFHNKFPFLQTHWKFTDMHFNVSIASSASVRKIMERADDVYKLLGRIALFCWLCYNTALCILFLIEILFVHANEAIGEG